MYSIILLVSEIWHQVKLNWSQGHWWPWEKHKKNSKSKTTTLRCFDNLKKRQQDQDGKNWCYTERFVTDNIKSQNYCILFWTYSAFEINFEQPFNYCIFPNTELYLTLWSIYEYKKHQFLNENSYWFLRHARAGTHASKFMCTIYRTRKIIVFSILLF